MNKSFYILVALIFSIGGWDLIVLEPLTNNKVGPIFALFWAFMGLVWFKKQPEELPNLKFSKYKIFLTLFVVGILLSFIPANLYSGQGYLASFIVNRNFFWLVFIPLLFYIKPSENEIIKALGIYSAFYIMVWLMQAITPYPLTASVANKIALGTYSGVLDDSEFGYLLPGFQLILFVLYYMIQKYKSNPSANNLIIVILLLVAFFLFQNRGTLFFAILVFIYSFLKIESKYKYLLYVALGILVVLAFYISMSYWDSIFKETADQINNPKYNRWRSLYFFIFVYPPSWICHILGNGFLSMSVKGGLFLYKLKLMGIYQSDLGIIGFWSMYGIIPLIAIYLLVFKVLLGKGIPFYLKAFAAHILVVPISWNFANTEIFIIILMIYLYAYNKEKLEEVTNSSLSHE